MKKNQKKLWGFFKFFALIAWSPLESFLIKWGLKKKKVSSLGNGQGEGHPEPLPEKRKSFPKESKEKS